MFSLFHCCAQSKCHKLHKEKVISNNATYPVCSFLILLMVCNPDILDQSSSSSSWWRGWSWCSCVSSCIFLSTLRFVYKVHVHKRAWHKSNSSLDSVYPVKDMFCFCKSNLVVRVGRIMPQVTYNHSPGVCVAKHPFLVIVRIGVFWVLTFQVIAVLV